MIEEFETIREFNIKFPSKIYICSRCGSLVSDPHQCNMCGCQSNNFLFSYKSYTYFIKDKNITNTIFKPVELEKGK